MKEISDKNKMKKIIFFIDWLSLKNLRKNNKKSIFIIWLTYEKVNEKYMDKRFL